MEGLNSICQHVDHCTSLLRSCFRILWSSVEVMCQYIMVSSAKSLVVEGIPSAMSLMYNRNRVGPRTEFYAVAREAVGIRCETFPNFVT